MAPRKQPVNPARNYLHNLRQEVPVSAAPPAAGYLIDQRQVAGFRFGSFPCDYNGCGWIALYNAARMLGCPCHPAELIRNLEGAPPFRGGVLGGLLGVYPWGIARFFARRGLRVAYSFRKKRIRQVTAKARANILLYQRRNGTAHFVAFQKIRPPGEEPLFLFLNYTDNRAPHYRVMTLAQLWKESRRLWSFVISIY